MSKYKICVYAICKNESKFVNDWMNSMCEADMIVVTDTGSTDDTVQKLRDRGAIVFEEIIEPWRFDVARNISLSHVPDDIDIVVCTDLDELLEPGWREAIEDSWNPNATAGRYIYNWSLNEDGTPDTQFIYSKVHKKNDYIWKYPVHEYLKYIGNGKEKLVFIKSMVLNHYPDASKSRSSYLSLLELGVKEDPKDDRMHHYLGREYMLLEKYQEGIKTLKNYLTLPSALWKEERSNAMRLIAKAYYELGKKEECYDWFYQAIDEMPTMRDPYIELAIIAYQEKDWKTVYSSISNALKITKKSEFYVNTGYSWNSTPEDLIAIACYWLGRYEEALDHVEKALVIDPKNERLQNNLKMIKEKIN